MRAMHIPAFNQPGNLVPVDAPRPVPADGQVLIRVHYAAVNRPDLLQRKGMHPPPQGASPLPGLDVAGEIVETRGDCGAWRVGDPVCALLGGGGYAEFAVADAALCLPVPKGLTMREAAALPECVFTVWNNLFLRGELCAGDVALIHGGASGIGSFALQMAKAAGAKIVTTAGSDEKCAACRALGADLAINYKTQDYAEEIEKTFGADSINVVLDMVGGDYMARNIRVMAPEGRHVSIAFLNGANAAVDIMAIMKKRLVITGSTLRQRPLHEKAKIATGLRDVVWPWIERGQVKPHIHAEFALEDALKAHEMMAASDHTGKIVLKV